VELATELHTQKQRDQARQVSGLQDQQYNKRCEASSRMERKVSVKGRIRWMETVAPSRCSRLPPLPLLVLRPQPFLSISACSCAIDLTSRLLASSCGGRGGGGGR
jgi:hypothetical protein